MPDRLVIHAIARTGSSVLCRIAGLDPDVAVLAEAFNPDGCFGLDWQQPEFIEAFCSHLGMPHTDFRDKQLVRSIAIDQMRALDALHAARIAIRKQAVIFKVLPGHLSFRVQEHLLADPRTAHLILMRRNLDAYISSRKALAIGRWNTIDTTDVHIRLDVAQFLDWMNEQTGWYMDLVRRVQAHNARAAFVVYEHDLLGDRAMVAQRIAGRLKSIGFPYHKLSFERDEDVLFRVQDRNSDPFARIENGVDVRRELAARGLLERALAYQLPFARR